MANQLSLGIEIMADIIFNNTVEPPHNEGPRDWQSLFAIARFHYIEVLFIYFFILVITLGKDNRLLYRGLPYIEVR